MKQREISNDWRFVTAETVEEALAIQRVFSRHSFMSGRSLPLTASSSEEGGGGEEESEFINPMLSEKHGNGGMRRARMGTWSDQLGKTEEIDFDRPQDGLRKNIPL